MYGKSEGKFRISQNAVKGQAIIMSYISYHNQNIKKCVIEKKASQKAKLSNDFDGKLFFFVAQFKIY